jgi:hypothetical protein
MQVAINPLTVEQLYRQLEFLMKHGHNRLPVVGTDSRAYFPIEAFDVLDACGYPNALQIRVRTDAEFTAKDGLCSKSTGVLSRWNDEATRVRSTCGAFA